MDIFWNYTLCDLRNEYIKFPSTNREVLATRETFDDLTDLTNVVAAIDGTRVKIKTHDKRRLYSQGKISILRKLFFFF